MTVVSMKRLLENGVHFGHQTRRWDPKMKPFIYAAKNGVYIIDLEKSQQKIDEAYNAMKKIAEGGGKVLFVGTKKQAQSVVLDEALRSGSFYVNQRWLGGILTNYRTIQKRIRRLVEIEEMEASGTINVYPKKEVAMIRKEATRLENFLGGIKEMKKLPDAVFVVDPNEEHNAVAEARKLNIPVFAMVDTNCNPEVVDFPIPANDDAIRSVKLIIGLLADAVVEAKAGLLTYAYLDDQDAKDITMTDVIVNVEQQAEENEKRRRQRNDERRPYNNNRGAGAGAGGRYNNDRRPYNNSAPRRENAPVSTTAPTSAPVQTSVKTEKTEASAPVAITTAE